MKFDRLKLHLDFLLDFCCIIYFSFKVSHLSSDSFCFYCEILIELIHLSYPFNAWCLLKGHTYLNESAAQNSRIFLSMYDLLVDTRRYGVNPF